jgi:hypothetical protein
MISEMKREGVFLWFDILKEKGLSNDLAELWVSIISHCIHNKETTNIGGESRHRIKRAAFLSTDIVCQFLKLDFYNSEDYKKAESISIKLVDSVYSQFREHNFTSGHKTKGEERDKVFGIIDVEKLPNI